MKILKNKFFIIALAVAVFLVIFISTLSLMGQTDPLKDIFNTVTMPVRYTVVKIGEAFDGFAKYFKTIDSLDRENSELESRVEELESMLADAEATLDENERLRSYLEIKESYPDFKMLDAMIVGYETDNRSTFFTLDRGSADGVNVGMPIIVKSGVVGSVCEVGKSWCRVRVITEASASVGACVKRSGEIGVVSGDISFKDTGLCKMTYLPENADIEVGDLIYTSGIGSVYPSGLFIGRVTEVGVDEYLRQKNAVIECAVDFENLRYVIIVTDFESDSD